jgi:predicted kinase
MPAPRSTRSVRISDDERGGWSSDRPRREGAPARPADMTVRCQVLAPSDRIRYSPGSLLVLLSASPPEAEAFAQRVLESPGLLLSTAKVRQLLSGRVSEEELEGRAQELLDKTVAKRLEAGETVVLAASSLDPAERERYVRAAAGFRRPRHALLLETATERVPDELRGELNALRRRLDAGELGAEGFQTALRLGGASLTELRRIVFQPAPRDD